MGVLREEGGLEGVLVAEVAGVPLTAGVAPIRSFNSPYSFHSSISSRSYDTPVNTRSKFGLIGQTYAHYGAEFDQARQLLAF